MATECIHGLDFARCDACSPKSPPPARNAAAARSATHRAPAKRGPASRAAAAPAKVDTGARRIFHLTHRRNLASILKAGRVLSDASGATPAVDISSADNRELRREVRAGSERAAPVSAFVPFFLVPNASLWERIRDSESDLRLAETVHTMPAADFVILVSTVRAAGESAVVADGDAADPATRFSELAESGGRMPRRLHEEEHVVFDAEFLVPESFAFDAVTLVGVANDKVRSDVRALLNEHGYTQKVSVYPPWFQPS